MNKVEKFLDSDALLFVIIGCNVFSGVLNMFNDEMLVGFFQFIVAILLYNIYSLSRHIKNLSTLLLYYRDLERERNAQK